MAVVDKYVNADTVAGDLKDAFTNGSVKMYTQTYEQAASDNDTSIWRLFDVPSNCVPVRSPVMCDAITGATDMDMGVYRPTSAGGAVIVKDCLMDGQTFASASKALNGLGKMAIENIGAKKLWEIAGLSKDPGGNLTVAITGNTVGSTGGTVVVQFEVIQP